MLEQLPSTVDQINGRLTTLEGLAGITVYFNNRMTCVADGVNHCFTYDNYAAYGDWEKYFSFSTAGVVLKNSGIYHIVSQICTECKDQYASNSTKYLGQGITSKRFDNWARLYNRVLSFGWGQPLALVNDEFIDWFAADDVLAQSYDTTSSSTIWINSGRFITHLTIWFLQLGWWSATSD